MYVYFKSEESLWTVGFNENGKWTSESDHDSKQEAAERVRYLNGGNITSPYYNSILEALGLILQWGKTKDGKFTYTTSEEGISEIKTLYSKATKTKQ